MPCSAQALYQINRNRVPGKLHGHPAGKSFDIVAKDGVAIGGLIAVGGARVDGLRVVFMSS